jgi:hypothetical protein
MKRKGFRDSSGDGEQRRERNGLTFVGNPPDRQTAGNAGEAVTNFCKSGYRFSTRSTLDTKPGSGASESENRTDGGFAERPIDAFEQRLPEAPSCWR